MKEVIEYAMKEALEQSERYKVPSIESIELVNKKGQELAEKVGANRNIVMLGTILMDIGLGEARSMGKGADHRKISISKAQKIFERFDIDDETKIKILQCIWYHHGGPFPHKEAEVCCNADCYRFLSFDMVKLHYEKWLFSMSNEEALKFLKSKVEEKRNALTMKAAKDELDPQYPKILGFIVEKSSECKEV